jgi:hypothetical protein
MYICTYIHTYIYIYIYIYIDRANKWEKERTFTTKRRRHKKINNGAHKTRIHARMRIRICIYSEHQLMNDLRMFC